MKAPRRYEPTLAELRALSAVSRLKSVSAAAKELNVSQPTISYHIKRLEERWETKLFRAQGRSLVQTDFTQDLLHDVCAINESINKLSQRLSEKRIQKPLSIGTSSSFASVFLLPRLERFRQLHPQIPVRINVANRFVNFAEDQIDVAIRLLAKPSQHTTTVEPSLLIPIPNEMMRIVCSPQYLEKLKGQSSGQSLTPSAILENASLIEEDGTYYWNNVLSSYSEQNSQTRRFDLSFNNADLVLQSALAGHGVAILRELYSVDAIKRGQLVEPISSTIDCERVFEFVLPENRTNTAICVDFMNWLGQEMRSANHPRILPTE